jgi:hypothetical protein
MCQHQSHEDRIFNAAVKLYAHKDITVDRAVREAFALWEKSVDNCDSDRNKDFCEGCKYRDEYDALADESVDDLPTAELISRGFMNVVELDKRQLPLDF